MKIEHERYYHLECYFSDWLGNKMILQLIPFLSTFRNCNMMLAPTWIDLQQAQADIPQVLMTA